MTVCVFEKWRSCSRLVLLLYDDGANKVSSQVFHDELSSMRLWVSMHVSDHSGFHYRQFLLKELITELSQSLTSPLTSSQLCSSTDPSSSSPHHHSRANGELSGAESTGDEAKQLDFTAVLQLFHQELELCSDLIQSFPGHETLWSHRFVCVVYQFIYIHTRFICRWFSDWDFIIFY